MMEKLNVCFIIFSRENPKIHFLYCNNLAKCLRKRMQKELKEMVESLAKEVEEQVSITFPDKEGEENNCKEKKVFQEIY